MKTNFKNKSFRKNRHENGQSLVELALTLPLIFLLLCGILEFGWVYGNSLAVENATREGVRVGIVARDQAENNQLVTDRILSMIPGAAEDTVITITYSDSVNFRAGDISATVNYTIKGITPLAPLFTAGGEFDLSAACTMKMS